MIKKKSEKTKLPTVKRSLLFYIKKWKIQMKGKGFQKIQLVALDGKRGKKPGYTNNLGRDWKESKINLKKAPVLGGFTGEFFQS